MNIAELAIRKSTLTWTLSTALLVLGWLSFENLPRRLDPLLTDRETLVITPYPGASAESVDLEVSNKIEQALPGLEELRRTESISLRGLSIVRAIIGAEHDESRLPQIRDELRRLVDDLQAELPPTAGPSAVEIDLDDPGGLYFVLAGEGFSQAELNRAAALLQRELTTLRGVRQAALFGESQESIFVDISKVKAKALGVEIEHILDALGNKNLPAEAGWLRVGPERVPIRLGGLFESEQDFGDLLIAGRGERLVRLDDVADIKRGYTESPRRLYLVDGASAIGIALFPTAGADPADLDAAVQRRLSRLQARLPLGMKLEPVSLHRQATATVDAMVTNLLQAVGIVTAALLLFMGLRAGLVASFTTLSSLAATLVVMGYMQITLDRISLCALIIALGMTTGNAIVFVDGMKAHMYRGMARVQAAKKAATENAYSMLAGTAIVVLAFAALVNLDDRAGDYTDVIYLVILIGVSLSWVAALTIAPVAAQRYLKIAEWDGEEKGAGGSGLYARLTTAAIQHRNALLAAIAAALALSLYGFGFVKQVFLPPAAADGFLVEVHFRAGTHIRESMRRMAEISTDLRAHEGVGGIITAIGDGPPPFLSADFSAPDSGSHYALSLVLVEDNRQAEEVRLRVQADLEHRIPDALVNVKRLNRALPNPGGAIQLRISGPNPARLRSLAEQAKAIITADPDAKAVRDDWGAKVKVARPVLARERARRMRIDRERIAEALRTSYSGRVTGFFRDGSELIPIVARAPLEERDEVEDMADIPVTSPLRGDQVSMLQIANRLETITEDARRTRRDGYPTITVHADAQRGPTFELLRRIKPQVEKDLGVDVAAYLGRDPGPDFKIDFETIPIDENGRIPLMGDSSFFISWGGEAENAAASLDGLRTAFPVYLGLMLAIAITRFKAMRQQLIVLLTLPLPIIGVTAGLLLFNQPFGFLSLVAVMGMSGMLMRSAVLMVERIDRHIAKDRVRTEAILVAGTNSLRPVALSAATTVLATLPLLQHDLFRPMAVTMMAGLSGATLLALVLVPALYAALFRAGEEEPQIL